MGINPFYILILNAHWNNYIYIIEKIFIYISPLVGIIGGYLIAKKSFDWQMKQQKKSEEKYITTLVQRSLDELSYNGSVLRNMLEAFNQSNNSRNDHWEWLEKIADSLQFESIKILLNSVTKESRLERAIEHLYLSYHEILACYHDVKQGYAQHRFLYSYKADSRKANETFKNIKDNLSLTIESTDRIVDIVSTEVEKLDKK
ncbi:hypothetical protein [Bacillus sp. 1P02SD]|uniref:hypothetical protein n=1 Tax=Bacillus sp. 1P02SD TaxID=3132264 RepID=UPI00399EFACB